MLFAHLWFTHTIRSPTARSYYSLACSSLILFAHLWLTHTIRSLAALSLEFFKIEYFEVLTAVLLVFAGGSLEEVSATVHGDEVHPVEGIL